MDRTLFSVLRSLYSSPFDTPAILRPMKMLRWFMVLMVVLAAVSLFLTFFHHHEDGMEHSDCPVCRLVQTVTGIFILAFAALLLAAFRAQKLFTVFESQLSSLFLASPLQGRAPPVPSF